MPKPNLIMGFWSGLPFQRLEYFVSSLRKSGYEGDVCLFTLGLSAEERGLLQGSGVHLPDTAHLLRPQGDFQLSQHFMYLDFLRRVPTLYRNVMIADVPNTIFQADPFQKPLKHDLVLLPLQKTVWDSLPNRFVLKAAYGPLADSVGPRRAVGAESVFGTPQGMIRYLQAMCWQIDLHKDKAHLAGLTQAIHNHLYHAGQFGDCGLDTHHDFAASIRHVSAGSVAFDETVKINGKAPLVIHQWDQHPKLAAHVTTSPNFRLIELAEVPSPELYDATPEQVLFAA